MQVATPPSGVTLTRFSPGNRSRGTPAREINSGCRNLAGIQKGLNWACSEVDLPIVRSLYLVESPLDELVTGGVVSVVTLRGRKPSGLGPGKVERNFATLALAFKGLCANEAKAFKTCPVEGLRKRPDERQKDLQGTLQALSCSSTAQCSYATTAAEQGPFSWLRRSLNPRLPADAARQTAAPSFLLRQTVL